MVHFHLHTNGSASEENEEGHAIIVNKYLVNAIWIGLGFLLWTGSILVLVRIVVEIRKLAA
jgi:hypothetical protein